MSIALGLLVYYQWRWVDTVIRANEEGFRKDVMAAMDKVVKKLEKQEAVYLVNQRFLRPTFRPVDRNIYQVDADPGVATYFFEANGNADSSGFNFFFSLDANGQVQVSSSFSQGGSSQLKERGTDASYVTYPDDHEVQSTLQKVSNKSEMIVTVLEEMMFPRRLLNRFDPSKLDSLIEDELREKGIRLDFDYGIINHTEARFVAISDIEKQQELANSQFQATLFPNDVVGDPSILSLHFPNESGYLSGKIWWTMSSSGGVILIILFCFGYAVRTIYRQKHISEMKNDFINNMTHELKTPIATIGLAAEALQDKSIQTFDAMREKYMGVIKEENTRLASQVEKVLQMALIDKQELKYQYEQIDLHEIITKAISKMSILIESKNGQITTAMTAEKSTIYVDGSHMLNVVLNLVDNAIKYSEDEPKIMIRTQVNRGEMSLSIKDHGIGMTKEEIKHIFQRFYRVPTGNVHNVKGFGLGLAYVKSVVETMNGSVHVDSEPGKGTNFIIKFPLHGSN